MEGGLWWMIVKGFLKRFSGLKLVRNLFGRGDRGFGFRF